MSTSAAEGDRDEHGARARRRRRAARATTGGRSPREHAARPGSGTPIGVATRELPTSGMNGMPVVTPVTSRSGASRVSRPRPSARTAEHRGGGCPSPARCGTAAGTGARDRTAAASSSAEQRVEPEDRPPVRHGQDRRPQQRPEHAAELLHRTDDPERGAAARRRPEVGAPGRASPAPRPPPPTPCSTRPDTSTGSSTAVAVRTEPTTNTTRQPSSTRCRGSRSASRPISGSTAT